MPVSIMVSTGEKVTNILLFRKMVVPKTSAYVKTYDG